MKKVFLIGLIFLVLIILAVTFAFVINEDLFCLFKEGKSLNYQKEIDYLVVSCSEDMQFIEDKERIIIDDKKDIDKIIEYLNSLEVVEIEQIREGSYEQGYISLDIELKKEVPDVEVFSFMGNNYLAYFDGDGKSLGKDFYIKDAECDENGKNKVYYFLYDLINSDKEKYLEKND